MDVDDDLAFVPRDAFEDSASETGRLSPQVIESFPSNADRKDANFAVVDPDLFDVIEGDEDDDDGDDESKKHDSYGRANGYDRSEETHGEPEGPSPCCPCVVNCECSHHFAETDPLMDRPIDSLFVYAFDSDLFSVPQNRRQFDIFVEYLRDQDLTKNSVVVAVSGDGGSGRDVFDSMTRNGWRLERSKTDSSVQRHRLFSANVIESVFDSHLDVRRLFRTVILEGRDDDWLTLKALLNYPVYVVYFRRKYSKNEVRADATVTFDYGSRKLVSSRGTLGLKIAQALASFRHDFLAVPHFDFTSLIETSKLRLLENTVKSSQQQRQRKKCSENEGDVRKNADAFDHRDLSFGGGVTGQQQQQQQYGGGKSSSPSAVALRASLLNSFTARGKRRREDDENSNLDSRSKSRWMPQIVSEEINDHIDDSNTYAFLDLPDALLDEP